MRWSIRRKLMMNLEAFKKLKIAVVGFGIMGGRHFNSLIKYGVKDIYLVRRKPDPSPFSGISGVYTNLEQLFSDNPLDGVIINTPSALHARDLIICFQQKVSVLIEKPVVTTLEDAKAVQKEYRSNRPPVVMVGYDLRYTPTMLRFKELLGRMNLGKYYFCQWDAGGYLPQWRPQKDYRSMYSAKADLGGGVVLDLSHELDGMMWLFGPPKEVTAKISHRSTLDIDVDDVGFMSFEYSGGVFSVNITVDYCRVPFTRRIRLVAEKGTLEVDEVRKTIGWFPVDGDAEVLFRAPKTVLTPFNREIENFLECIAKKDENLSRGASLWDGLKTVGLIEAIMRSSENKKTENVKSFLHLPC